MCNTLLGGNSFILWPASFIFLLYSIGHSILYLEWKMFVIAAIFFAITTVVEVVLATLAD